MSRIAVLGSGIVGRAAAWDLVRRGHEVSVADAHADAARSVAEEVGAASSSTLDASDRSAVTRFLEDHAVVVSAVPYALGESVAPAAIDSVTHYLDFGGNPTVVAAQLRLDEQARSAGVALVPDCGLAPGLANVMAAGLVARLGDGPVDEVRIRVGALPVEPTGALGYQLAFNPAGLVNEYAEPCEILTGGEPATAEPLTGLEEVAWDRWGPLEAFHTAGGSSTLPEAWRGRVEELDYKTLRYPGHCRSFRAMLEIGLFDESPQPGSGTAPRTVLLEALDTHLPRSDDDLVLVRVWARRGHTTEGLQVEDRHDGAFSALARTTAFPATALAHLMTTGVASDPGARAMATAVEWDLLEPELSQVGITATPWSQVP
jgi:lysine 6-dehydrogenase